MKGLVNEFVDLSDPATPDHFSGLLFISMVQATDAEQTETQRDVERAVFAKGSLSDLQNMLANVFTEQPGLFALIQEAVVTHVYKNYQPEEAVKMLKKEG